MWNKEIFLDSGKKYHDKVKQSTQLQTLTKLQAMVQTESNGASKFNNATHYETMGEVNFC